jgi:choline kinase
MPKLVILAAGEGKRLRPYTADRPKCLVEVDGRSLLDRQLDVVAARGIGAIVLIGGYRAEMLRGRGAKLKCNPRYSETNMVWTLFCAEDELVGDVIISYGDIVYSVAILDALLASPADVAVTIDLDWEAYWRARNEDPLSDAETLKLAADGQIVELGRRPETLEEIQGQYMGLMKFSARGVETLKLAFQRARAQGSIQGKPPENAYMTDMLQTMIDAGIAVQSVPVHGGWVEVDTVGDLESDVTRARLAAIASR